MLKVGIFSGLKQKKITIISVLNDFIKKPENLILMYFPGKSILRTN